MKSFGKLYSKYYDKLYNSKNYIRETNFIIKLIKKFISIKDPLILELGSGTGGHAFELVKKKYRIEGLERSKVMIKYFKKKNKKIKIYNQDMRTFNLKKKYDIILALFNVVNYLISINDFEKMVNSAKKHLNKNGIIIFDYWNTDAVNYLKPKKKIFKYSSNKLSIIRSAVPIIKKNKRIDILYSLNVTDKSKKYHFNEKHSVRHYSINELEKIFKNKSFKLLYNREMITGLKPSKKKMEYLCSV